jgi:hypothetical protein
MTSVVVV